MPTLDEYEKAKRIIKEYLKDHNDQDDCECKKEWLIRKEDYNSYPYGGNYVWDECTKCKKKHNFRNINENNRWK